MTEPMRVDTEGLRGAEPSFRYLSSSLGNILTRLVGTLDGANSCWGGDELGDTFAASYVPAAQLIRDALPRLRDNVGGVAEALLAAADNVDAAEGRARTRLS